MKTDLDHFLKVGVWPTNWNTPEVFGDPDMVPFSREDDNVYEFPNGGLTEHHGTYNASLDAVEINEVHEVSADLGRAIRSELMDYMYQLSVAGQAFTGLNQYEIQAFSEYLREANPTATAADIVLVLDELMEEIETQRVDREMQTALQSIEDYLASQVESDSADPPVVSA